VAQEYHALADALAGTTVKAQVAIIYDYENIWAIHIQPGFEGNSFREHMMRYYSALFRAGVNVDMIKPTEDLSQYKVVIAPQLFILPDAVAKRLSEYVAAGGVLLTDLRTGVKDETGLCYDRTLPGLLSDALGITIEEYEVLSEGMEYLVGGMGGLEGRYTAVKYADWVSPQKAVVLAGYAEWHMQWFAAATRNQFGKGFGYYVGSVIKEPAFYDGLMAEVLKSAGVQPVVSPPDGVEASVREGGGKKLLFLVNHSEETKTVPVPAGKQELLSGTKTQQAVELDKYGVSVIQLE